MDKIEQIMTAVRQRKCPRCGNRTEKKTGYCTPCHADYMRRTRPKHKDLPDDQRKRANDRAKANVYKRRARLKALKMESGAIPSKITPPHKATP